MPSATAAAVLVPWLFCCQTLLDGHQAALGQLTPTQVTTRSPFDDPGLARSGDEGLTLPILIRKVWPPYTAEAMRAWIAGVVKVECIVRTDGTVDDVRVTESLDKEHGLDNEAVKAAKRWKCKPGTKNGQPVPVLIEIEMQFALAGVPGWKFGHGGKGG